MKLVFTPYGVIRKAGEGEVLSPWLTAEEAAAYLGVGTAEAVRSYVRAGDLAADGRRGNQMLFSVTVLDAFVRQRGVDITGSDGQ